jgi:hypothetical protein
MLVILQYSISNKTIGIINNKGTIKKIVPLFIIDTTKELKINKSE